MADTGRTRAFMTELFERIERGDGDYTPLLDALADDLEWTVTGSSPIAGTYRGKADYVRRCYGRLDERLAAWPRARVEEIVVDGEVAIVFFTGTNGRGHNGIDYTMRYCWRMRVTDGRIDRVIAYIDDVVVTRLFG